MNKLLSIALISLVAVSVSAAERVEDIVSAGNEAFENQQYKEALEQYQIAETELPESPELDYNIAGVLHHQDKYEEAVEKYTKALNSPDASVTGRAHYNLGNTYFRMDDFVSAIAQYEEVLKLDPSDLEAKYNLELSRKKLKDQMESQDEEQEDQQQQEQQEQEEQEQQQNQDESEEQEDQEQQQQQQQDQDENQDQDQDQDQQQQPQPDDKEMSREDAERILNALRDDEQDIQKKIKREAVGGNYRGRDW